MRSLLSLSLAACLALTLVRPAHPQAKDPPIGPAAASYLERALDTLQAVTLRSDSIPWRVVRDSAFLLAAGAREPRDTWGAIDWALHRVNQHSFLQAPRPGAVHRLVSGHYGYVHVPQRGGASVSLADSLHVAVGSLEAAGACGWIVDLRGNGGGNMWPMLAGIGPLLGDSLVGSFGTGPTADRWYYRDGLSGILHPNGQLDTLTRITGRPVQLRRADAPVAVLIDGGTGSAGEDVAIAFLGRPNVRTFGSPSAGYTTINRGSRLPDGANMVVTTGYNVDRRGVVHPTRLEPDSAVGEAAAGWPFATDRVGTAAAAWLATRSECHRSP